MSTLLTVILVVVGGFVALMVGLNLFIRAKAKAMRGQELPKLPGRLGESIGRSKKGLVYFFSPSCAACRTLTPVVQKAAKANKNVFAVDVTQHLELARALKILATPSTLEVEEGRVVDVHVGMLPRSVMERLSPST
ncbi:MAG: thioredoxin family protein [Polyangiaceae bacterium]